MRLAVLSCRPSTGLSYTTATGEIVSTIQKHCQILLILLNSQGATRLLPALTRLHAKPSSYGSLV
jgi:hypothetical protein